MATTKSKELDHYLKSVISGVPKKLDHFLSGNENKMTYYTGIGQQMWQITLQKNNLKRYLKT